MRRIFGLGSIAVLAMAAPPAAAGPTGETPNGDTTKTPIGETPTSKTPTGEPVGKPPGKPPIGEMTPADVAGAPVAGDESGRTDGQDDSDSLARRGLRGALFLPKVAVDVALSPLRLSVWAYDRYHLEDWYYRIFYNDARTIGLIPTLSFDTGFGGTAGARFVHHDLLGEREQLLIEGATGGRYHGILKASLSSGDRLGRLGIELAGQYELRPKDPFYGIGNHADSAAPPAPVDPAIDPTAVDTRYRERIARVATVLDLRLVDGLHLRSSGELTDRKFSPSDRADGMPIDAIYDPMTLVGYGGVRYLYSELELRFDDRRAATPYEPRPVFSLGSLAAVFGGRIHRLDHAPDYWRYGIDLQQFFRLGVGPRVLAFRLHGEAVSGALSDVPFTELPQLGGLEDLRGYPIDRFRDRVAALGSMDYSWDLTSYASARVFVDAGRVFASVDELGLDHLRLGYGVALEGYSLRDFALVGAISSSIDGGLFLNLSFNPMYRLDERVRRR